MPNILETCFFDVTIVVLLLFLNFVQQQKNSRRNDRNLHRSSHNARNRNDYNRDRNHNLEHCSYASCLNFTGRCLPQNCGCNISTCSDCINPLECEINVTKLYFLTWYTTATNKNDSFFSSRSSRNILEGDLAYLYSWRSLWPKGEMKKKSLAHVICM